MGGGYSASCISVCAYATREAVQYFQYFSLIPHAAQVSTHDRLIWSYLSCAYSGSLSMRIGYMG
jgi:hypothetical protein